MMAPLQNEFDLFTPLSNIGKREISEDYMSSNNVDDFAEDIP